MRTHLALLLAALAAPALAQQPSAPPAAQAAPPAKPSASVFSPSRAVAAAALGTPQAPLANGFQGGQPPAVPGLPLPGGLVAPAAPAADTPQEVPAVYVGKVNGVNVYRAAGGYLFEKTQRPKAVPKETGSVSDTAATSSTAKK